MTLKPRRRAVLYWVLAATLAVSIVISGKEDDLMPEVVVRAANPSRPAASSPESSPDVDVDALKQRSAQREFGDMFPVRSWLPPPPPPAKPPPPKAPPLPFTFFGRMVEEGRTVVFLSRQEQIFAVKAGDSVVGGYRIEEIGPSSVVLLYLPLQERQVLNIGAIN